LPSVRTKPDPVGPPSVESRVTARQYSDVAWIEFGADDVIVLTIAPATS
jgi:hypothetical protein